VRPREPRDDRRRLRRAAIATAAAGAAALALLSCAREARAMPQTSVGLTVGPALTDLRTRTGLELHLGLRGDLLLFRRRESDMAVGPYVDVATAAFDTFEAGGGIEWLVPVTREVPAILSFGGLARDAPGTGWGPSLEATLFLGSRSYNFDSVYGLGAGGFLQGRYGLGDDKQADIILGAQIDLEIFALPVIAIISALTH
jgi:hypothetical protein